MIVPVFALELAPSCRVVWPEELEAISKGAVWPDLVQRLRQLLAQC